MLVQKSTFLLVKKYFECSQSEVYGVIYMSQHDHDMPKVEERLVDPILDY